MSDSPPSRQFAPWPAAPGNAATIILFCTHPKVPSGGTAAVRPSLEQRGGIGKFDVREMECVDILWHKNDQASAANGVRVYVTDDGGVTWFESDRKSDTNAATIGAAAPVQVPVLASPQEWRETFVVADCQGVAIEYTAGATGPTAVTGWRGTITCHRSRVSVAR